MAPVPCGYAKARAVECAYGEARQPAPKYAPGVLMRMGMAMALACAAVHVCRGGLVRHARPRACTWEFA